MAARILPILLLSLFAAAAGPDISPAVYGAEVSAATAAKPDPLVAARQFYNLGQYEQAIAAAREAALRPAALPAARLIMGRSRLEKFRATQIARDLEDARADLRAVDPALLDPRERAELQVGLGQLLFLEDRFGAAAELLWPVIEQTPPLAPEARARALEWWAAALDRHASSLPPADRTAIHTRIIAKMEDELQRDPTSAPAGYWIAAASRAAGDLDRAWSAALAGWIRATLARDRGLALRTDLDKLVIEGIIPDRARLAARDRRQVAAALTAEWEAFKKGW
jgi:hypothetical protein